MRRLSVISLLVLAVLSCGCARKAVPAPAEVSGFSPAVVPAVGSSELREGSFTFTEGSAIYVESDSQKAMAETFAGLLDSATGFSTPVFVDDGMRNVAAMGNLRFISDEELGDEEYTLDITTFGITVGAGGDAGFFYALQTLRQLLPASCEAGGDGSAPGEGVSLPCMRITDGPRFGYRGLLLDVARCFLPKDYVMQVIDCMGMLKLNKLHWHLTDDNGWRVEIKRYPLLTDVGAWRVDRDHTPFPARRNPSRGEETPVGGYYTQDEIREIVSYAAERNVEIIPEIDIPAHSNAALAAYPQYACPVVKDFIGVLPGIGGRNADIIYCAGNDSVYVFLQNVLDEVMDLFPSRYIHIGGDEAGKSNWEKCSLCQKRIREEHLGGEEDLQGYFMGRIASYVRSRGREVIGWDELTNSAIPDDAIVIGWQENGSAALKAAAQGHRFVMAPAKLMYIIRYQGPQWFEPLTYFGNITLKDLYDYEPIRPNWPARYSDLLMGVECCMWTEFCYGPEDVSYLLFPRLSALADIAWAPRGSKNWPDFLRRADAFLPRVEAKGIEYARSMYNIQHTVVPTGHGRSLSVTLDCIRPDVEIRYTLDGTDPTDSSALYTAPVIVDSTLTLTCATFRDGEQLGRTLSLPLQFNKATGAKIRAKGDAGVLVNGLRGSLKQTDFEWRTWQGGQPMNFTVDLGQTDTLSRVTVGTITNYGMAVHKPSSMTLEVSEGGLRYTLAGHKTFTPQEIFREGTYIEDIVFDLDSIPARYLRVSFKDAGPCPKDHVRPGMASKVYFDEIIVE